jgi:hypothetical protein
VTLSARGAMDAALLGVAARKLGTAADTADTFRGALDSLFGGIKDGLTGCGGTVLANVGADASDADFGEITWANSRGLDASMGPGVASRGGTAGIAFCVVDCVDAPSESAASTVTNTAFKLIGRSRCRHALATRLVPTVTNRCIALSEDTTRSISAVSLVHNITSPALAIWFVALNGFVRREDTRRKNVSNVPNSAGVKPTNAIWWYSEVIATLPPTFSVALALMRDANVCFSSTLYIANLRHTIRGAGIIAARHQIFAVAQTIGGINKNRLSRRCKRSQKNRGFVYHPHKVSWGLQ